LGKSKDELIAWKKFTRSINITLPEKGRYATVSFTTESSELSAQWANKYTEMVLAATKQQLITNIQSKIDTRLIQVNLQISSFYAAQLENYKRELSKLEEALKISKSLNIKAPDNRYGVQSVTIDYMPNKSTSDIRSLYRQGENAIQREIAYLKEAIENNDLIPSEAEDFLRTRRLLNSIDIDESKIQVARFDLKAEVDNTPVSPKKTLILAISLISGLFLGFFVAFIHYALEKRRLKRSQ